MIAVVVCLAAVLFAVSVLLWWRSTHGLLATRCRKQVIVTLKSGSAFSGVLAATDRDAVVLVSARFVKPDETAIPVDGEVIVLRSDVDFLQRP